MGLKIQTCEFISVTDLVPKHWGDWFWGAISSSAPFTWGDNDRSMVTARAFANHCQEMLDDSAKVQRFLKKVRSLGEMYVDLES